MTSPQRYHPSRRFLPSKPRRNVASSLLLTRSAAYCGGNVGSVLVLSCGRIVSAPTGPREDPIELVGAGACRRCERVARGSPLGGQPAETGRRPPRGLPLGVNAAPYKIYARPRSCCRAGCPHPAASIGTLSYVDGGLRAPRPTNSTEGSR